MRIQKQIKLLISTSFNNFKTHVHDKFQETQRYRACNWPEENVKTITRRIKTMNKGPEQANGWPNEKTKSDKHDL